MHGGKFRMSHRIYLVIGIGITIFVIFSAIVNRSINKTFRGPEIAQPKAQKTSPSPPPEKKSKLPEPLVVPPKSVGRHTLDPDDPARFGILVQKEGQVKTQSQWDIDMDRVLIRSQVPIQKAPAFAQTKVTAKEFQKKMQLVNERITQCERLAANDPSNEEARQKLQTFYMLKSTLASLEHAIVIPESSNSGLENSPK